MKNHYFTPYVGNKRREIKDIIQLINLYNIKYIIEPFAGSSAMSYYISTLYPNRFKYILNDNDKINYELFNISRDAEKTQQFNLDINKIIDEWNTYTDDVSRKAFYKSIDDKTLEGYIFKAKYNVFRFGVYPSFTCKHAKQFINIKPYKLEDYTVYKFYNNEDITYENIDGVELINKYNEGDEAGDKLYLIDPPYLNSCNKYYNNLNMDIYKWILTYQDLLLNNNNKFIFILENIKEVEELFSNFKTLLVYDKTYYMSSNKTIHIVYSN